jgi:hypothetical protein
MSWDRAIIVVRGFLQLAEARHWKLCTQPRLSEAFKRLFNRDKSGHIFLDSDDGSDDDENWEDNMDPLTFARYYAGPSNPHFFKMVQDHDRETRARFNNEIKSWVEGVVVSADSELGAY